MAVARNKKGTPKRTGGRRRNYAPAPDEVGLRGHMPTGWANWLGFVLFGFVSVAVLVAAVGYAAGGTWADAGVAAALGVGMAYMVYLFSTTKLRV